jgi:hypothetical protein
MQTRSSVLFWNCANGVFNKKPLIEKYIEFYEPCVFFVSECEVSVKHCQGLLNIKDYDVEFSRTLESKGKCRTLAYVKRGLGIVRHNELENNDNEIIVLRLKKQFLVGVYAGFKTEPGETVQTNFERLLLNLGTICDKAASVIVGGDFNADPERANQKSDSLIEWQLNHGLDQHVKEITRIRLVDQKLQKSMIDLVFSKEIDELSIEVKPSECSDHHLIAARFAMDILKQDVKFEKRIVVDWRRYTDEKMNAALLTNLREINIDASVEVLDRDVTTALLNAMNTVIPKRVIHLRRQTDMVNYSIEAMKKKRDRLIKKAKKENCAKSMSEVKFLDKAIKKQVVKERSRLINNKMKNSSANTFWSTMNDLLGRSGGKDMVHILDETGESFLNDEDTSEAFIQFFSTKVRDLIGKNPIEDEEPEISDATTTPFSLEEMRTAISTFKPKKSAGPDEVPLMVLKTCYPVLEPVLSRLFEKIVLTNRIPRAWKVARIKPIHKKGPASVVKNFRPISNLNSVSKLFERCILNRISGVDDGENQHGFKAGHSTVTAALDLQNEIAKNLDAKKKCLVYSMDLSAAFDLIRPGIFSKKARQIVRDDGIVNLLLDFISDRRAYVEIGLATSTQVLFPVGCPQGSTLGPKIFSLYCHDLSEAVKGGYVVTYADDSYVLVTGEDTDGLKSNAESTMAQHLDWLHTNGMVCNMDKTEIMMMDSEEEAVLDVGGFPVKSTKTMKVLGMVFDHRMEWTSQVTQTINKTHRLYHGMKHLKRFLSKIQLKQALTAYYFSVLYYGIEVWYHRHLSSKLKNRVRSAHYRALRLLYGKEKTRDDLDATSERATPDEMSEYSLAKLTAKMYLVNAPARLLKNTMNNAYKVSRKPGQLFFYDTSFRMIGRQCLANRLPCITKQMKFKWLECEVSSLRVNLKKCFFKYAIKANDKSQSSV